MIAEYQNKFNSVIVQTLLDMDAMSQASLEQLVNVAGQNQYDRKVITTDPATSIIPMRVSIPRRYSRATGKRYTMRAVPIGAGSLQPDGNHGYNAVPLESRLYVGPELSDSPDSSDCDQIKTDCTASGAYQVPKS